MNFQEIKGLIISELGENIVTGENTTFSQPQLFINPHSIKEVCETLLRHPSCYFDFLSSITGMDNGNVANTMELIYHLYSLPYEHSVVLKCTLKRTDNHFKDYHPTLPSVSEVYKTAIWHEREIYDLLGIHFSGHPDLRRIFLPEDWTGHPLRKDYEDQLYYHGIKVKY